LHYHHIYALFTMLKIVIPNMLSSLVQTKKWSCY